MTCAAEEAAAPPMGPHAVEQTDITVCAPTGYELWGMVHVGMCRKGSLWSCGLEHEVEGVVKGRFNGAGSARSGWPGGGVLHVATVPSAAAARRVLRLVAARLPAACSAKLSDNMQRWEKEHRTQARCRSEGPRIDGSPGGTCKDSIGYHGSYQMSSSLRESCGIFRTGIPRSAVLEMRGRHAHTAAGEMVRLVKEAVQGGESSL